MYYAEANGTSNSVNQVYYLLAISDVQFTLGATLTITGLKSGANYAS